MQRTKADLFLSALAMLLLFAPHAQAATLTVTNPDDYGSGSLRDRIDLAAPGDTITFAIAGTIYIGDELEIYKNLTITGPAAGIVVVPNEVRAFNIASTATVSMTNLTISSGILEHEDADGGWQGHPDGDAGRSYQGGGILNNGVLTLRKCTISGNKAWGSNGGSSFKLPCDCAGLGTNYVGAGGLGGTAQGGGIFNVNRLTLINCTVSGNVAQGGDSKTGYIGGSGGSASGGGIYNQGTLTATNCTFSGNVAKGGNAAPGYYGGFGGFASGGAIDNVGGTLTVTNCTFSGNSVTAGNGGNNITSSFPDGDGGNAYGGGLSTDGTVTMRNSLVAKNTVKAGSAGTYGNPGAATGPDVAGTVTSTGYNLIGDGSGSSGFTATGDQVGTAASPLDPKLDTLKSNGGLTQTMALLPGSPAIDKGGSGTTTDQRGLTRPLDDPAIANAANGSDIGAYERDVVAQSGPDFIVNTLDEHSDHFCGVADCSLWDAGNAAGANPDVSTITFKAGLSGTITTKLQNTGIHISSAINIVGPGARVITISGGGLSRVFRLFPGAVVTISGLTIANGYSLGDGTNGGGGGILSEGTLTLRDCAVLNNKGGSGGGVYSTGTLTIINCSFASNDSTGHGGAVRNSGTATITNSTFTRNTATTPSGSGTITSSGTSTAPGSLTLHSCTVSGNSTGGADSGSGLFNFGTSTFTVGNSIVVGNTAPSNSDLAGAFTSQGYNRIGGSGSATGFTATGDLTGVTTAQIKLGALANNGGPTDTLALLPGSVAIDKGKSTLTTDQRGKPRPMDAPGIANTSDGSDIGAFEVQPPFLTINNASQVEGNSGTSLLVFTVTLSPASSQTVTVKYATANSTATAVSDYVTKSGTLTFAAGVTTQPVSITINGDTAVEANEIFRVNLSAATNAFIADSQGNGTITNDDS